MADYYTTFAADFTPISPEQRAFIEQAFRLAESRDADENMESSAVDEFLQEHDIPQDADDFLMGVDIHVNKSTGILSMSSEGGGEDHVADIIAAAQRKFGDDRTWSVEVAHTCSRMRSDGFGGSAVFVHKGKCHYWSTSQFITQKEQEAK